MYFGWVCRLIVYSLYPFQASKGVPTTQTDFLLGPNFVIWHILFGSHFPLEPKFRGSQTPRIGGVPQGCRPEVYVVDALQRRLGHHVATVQKNAESVGCCRVVPRLFRPALGASFLFSFLPLRLYIGCLSFLKVLLFKGFKGKPKGRPPIWGYPPKTHTHGLFELLGEPSPFGTLMLRHAMGTGSQGVILRGEAKRKRLEGFLVLRQKKTHKLRQFLTRRSDPTQLGVTLKQGFLFKGRIQSPLVKEQAFW